MENMPLKTSKEIALKKAEEIDEKKEIEQVPENDNNKTDTQKDELRNMEIDSEKDAIEKMKQLAKESGLDILKSIQEKEEKVFGMEKTTEQNSRTPATEESNMAEDIMGKPQRKTWDDIKNETNQPVEKTKGEWQGERIPDRPSDRFDRVVNKGKIENREPIIKKEIPFEIENILKRKSAEEEHKPQKSEKINQSTENEKTKICPKCGVEMPFSANFCGKCGKELRFNPDAELKKIRTGTREEQKQKLAEFKEKLAEQKKGISEIQAKLFEKIENNPDASIEEYQKSVSDLVEKHNLSFDQQRAIERGLNVYSRTHEAIRENAKDCLMENGEIDGPKLYEKLFNKKPVGRIEVILRPANIYLRIEDLEDYANAYNHGRGINAEIINEADKSEGAKLGNFYIKGLENAITLEKATKGRLEKMSEYAKSVLEHEEQHSINALIAESYNPEQKQLDKKREAINKLNDETIKSETLGGQIIMEDPYEKRNVNIESRLKDEISAYFKEEHSPEEIRKILLKPETIYDYGFRYKGGDKEKSEFSKKYIDLVENGILAYSNLLKAGCSKEEVQGLLFVEPLSKWMKVSERIIGKRKSERKKKRDVKKLRGEDVISRTKKFIRDNF